MSVRNVTLALLLIATPALAQPAQPAQPDAGMIAAMSTAAQGMLAESLQRELAWRARAAGLEAEVAKLRSEAAKPAASPADTPAEHH